MKVTISRDQLAGAVTWAARALPARPTQPVLAGMLLRAGAGTGLALSAFDYEISAQVGIPVDEAGEPGDVLVSGRLLNEITQALPAKPVHLEADQTRLTVRCGAARFTLLLLPADEYPVLPDLPPLAGRAGSETFAAAVGQVAVAAGKDDTLPALTCIRAEIDGDLVTLAATDRYRLAIRELRWTPAYPDITGTATIPARVLLDAARAATSAAEVTVHLDRPDPAGPACQPGLAGIDAGGRRTTVRLCGGEFPKYRQLIPTAYTCSAQADVAELTAAVQRAALVAARNAPVRFTFTAGQLTLEAGTSDEATATEVIDAEFDGDSGFQVSYQPHYLLDGLKAVGGGKVRISFTTPAKPAVFTAASDGDEPCYRYVLMPIRAAG